MSLQQIQELPTQHVKSIYQSRLDLGMSPKLAVQATLQVINASGPAMTEAELAAIVAPTPKVVAPAEPATAPKIGFFQSIAQPLAARGLKVMPVDGKVAFLSNHPQEATADLNKIKNDWRKYADCNVAVHCLQEQGGAAVVDVDGSDIRPLYTKETGKPFPATYTVQSSPNKYHFYFWQTPKTLALPKNIVEGDTNGEFSLRVKNYYVVGEGSVHPEHKGRYTALSDAPIVAMPDDLFAWLVGRAKSKPAKEVAKGTGDIPKGMRDTVLTSISGSLRDMDFDEEAIYEHLSKVNDERCNPPKSDAAIRRIAHSIGKKPDGLTKRMNEIPLIGGVPASEKPHVQTAEGKAAIPDVSESAEMVRADKIKSRRIDYLWNERIPLNKLSVLCGNPDEGKSLVSIYVIAKVTQGRPLYGDQEAQLPASEVLIMAAEDDPEDTIRPRLEAAGADLSKVHILTSIVRGTGETKQEREARLDTDLRLIEATLVENPQIRLVVIDPISSYLGGANMNREQEVRQILNPLKMMAARCKVAVVMIMHLNKNNDASAIHRIGGAVAFTGVARAVWLFTKSKDEQGDEIPDVHLMLRVKNNLARPIGGLVYKIPVRYLDIDGKRTAVPYTEFEGD